MPAYKVPLREYSYVLHEVLDAEAHYRGLGREDVNAELMESVLDGAARFAEDVVAPTNEPGDRIGVRRTDDGRVVTPPGFVDAYRQYVEDGWAALCGPAEAGGQRPAWVLVHPPTEVARRACGLIQAQLSLGGRGPAIELREAAGPTADWDLRYVEWPAGDPRVDLERLIGPRGLAPGGAWVTGRLAELWRAEDETDLSRVAVDLALFEALVQGYREATRSFLTEDERSWLAFSGQLLAYETGVRFLTDHLGGDRYFRIHRPGHNLDRARNQFQLVRSLLLHAEDMDNIVADHR